jgi:hypothetical protein
MAVQGPFKVEFGELFPHGLGVVGAVGPVVDFDASTKERKVQARDKDSGLPVWSVDVMDFDPEARERTFKVKFAAVVQPVPPDALDGLPVRPVVLDGVTVTPYLKEVGNGRSRIAYSLRAAGMHAPGEAPSKAAAGGSSSAA